MTRSRLAVVWALSLLVLIAVGVFGLFAVEWVAERLVSISLVYPPHTVVRYSTTIMDWEARTNQLGVRDDREIPIRSRHKWRALLIGDSYTFGWGVNTRDTWKELVETNLQKSGLDVELVNAGRPGSGPHIYSYTAERIVPILKPDLVLVNLLQGNDWIEAHPRFGSPSMVVQSKYPRLRILAEKLFPGLLAYLDHERLSATSYQESPLNISDVWRRQMAEVLQSGTPQQKAFFQAMDPEPRSLLVSGNMNFSLGMMAAGDPDYFLRILDQKWPDRAVIDRALADQLLRIRNVCEQNGCAVVVVSVPYGPFVEPDTLAFLGKLGFKTSKELLTTDEPDRVFRSAAESAKLPFWEFTRVFRAAAGGDPLYIKWDGHFSKAGNRLFARVLEPLLRRALVEPRLPN